MFLMYVTTFIVLLLGALSVLSSRRKKQNVWRFTTISCMDDLYTHTNPEGNSFLKALFEDPLSLIGESSQDLLSRIQEIVKQNELSVVKTKGATLVQTFPFDEVKFSSLFQAGTKFNDTRISWEEFVRKCFNFEQMMTTNGGKFSFVVKGIEILNAQGKCLSISLVLAPKGTMAKMFPETLHVTLAAEKNKYNNAEAVWALFGRLVSDAENNNPMSLKKGVSTQFIPLEGELISETLSAGLIPPPKPRKV